MVTEPQTNVDDAYRKVMASFDGHVDRAAMEQDVATLVLAAANDKASRRVASMQDWVAQALERMQPILDGSELTDRYFEVEKEAMRDILDRVEWLVQHFKVMPEPCHADHSEIFRAGGVAALNSVVATMKALPERGGEHPLQRATWDFHPHEEDGA